ncbi:fibrocystin-L isoform X2 [Nematostella vectensis]|nr:fibrocystin-L isoform X2 [Nematostella vectensis]
MTPTITSLSPRYGLPGSLLTIRGRIFTDRYLDSKVTDNTDVNILRVFAGYGLCDPINNESEELYGISLDASRSTNGRVTCKPRADRIGSQRVSFIVSGYGRSQMSRDALLVDSRDRLYLFQAHADIESVSPSAGSLAGGTILNITGKFFEKEKLKVTVDGIPCEILSASQQTIRCQTAVRPSHESNNGPYPGARGILREVWTSTKAPGLSSVAGLSLSAIDYHSEVLTEASSPSRPSFGESTSYSSRLRGFFVPPSDNNYVFYIRADDKADLYLSMTHRPEDKQKIATCPSSSTTWDRYQQQRSAVIPLQEGTAYYIEANHIQGGERGHVSIGVKLEKTQYVNSQISSAVNEKQTIRIQTNQKPDRQIINATHWGAGRDNQVQLITLKSVRTMNDTDACNASDLFRLGYAGEMTTWLPTNISDSDLEAALNSLDALRDMGNVTVTQSSNNRSRVYRVGFVFENPEDAMSLELDASETCSMNITITTLTTGQNGQDSFRFTLAGRISPQIPLRSSAREIEDSLDSMFKWDCTYRTPPSRAWFYNGFEGRVLGPEFGARVVEERPYCGRRSLKNPSHLFRAGQSRDLGGRVLKGFDAATYRQVCFAYKGMVRTYLSYLIYFTDKLGNEQRVWRMYHFTSATSPKWRFTCTGIHDNLMSDNYIKIRANMDYGVYVDAIAVARVPWKDVYFDDVFIWREAVDVRQTQAAAEPGGHVIKTFSVTEVSPAVWAISLAPVRCGTGLPMIGILGAKLVSNTDKSMTYRPANETGPANFTVSRDQEATPAVGGTFDVSFKGQQVKGLPVDISSDDLKSSLEENLDIGKVSVSRIGTCAGYTWIIEWATTGGDQPDILVNGTSLTGKDVTVITETVTDGGMFLRPIPGDMLRVAEPNPQVRVSVDSIPSSCSSRKCTFQYNPSATPTLTSISPTAGTSGTELTINGTGFSATPQDNIVNIGETPCNVTSSTSTLITCTLGHAHGGLREVSVRVQNKGFAVYKNSQRVRRSTYRGSSKLMFEYLITVISVTPNIGSIAGGTRVTIFGEGFSYTAAGIAVSFGETPCVIIKATVSQIQCITTKHSAQSVDIQVQVGDKLGKKAVAFTYDASVTPEISYIGPLTQSVSGGNIIMIRGRGFGSSGKIMIGSKPCIIINYFSTFVRCSPPAHAPGVYDVMVYVANQGYASYNGAPPRMEYVLVVTDVFPRVGSMLGGTMVRITGRGFSDDAASNEVRVGGAPCEVVSSRSDQIVCQTGNGTVTHHVDNSGKHPEFGIGYAWSKHTLTVHAGDTVQWTWSSPMMTSLTYGVEQTSQSDPTTYDGKGFRSAKGPKGSFAHTFVVPGEYYYASGPVDPYGAINMKGMVVVLDVKSRLVGIMVKIGDVVALNDTTHAGPAYSSSSNCPDGITMPVPWCSVPLPGSPQKAFQFEFSECSTPEIESITPNMGTSSTLVTIRGKGFGSSAGHNEVKIADQPCIVVGSKVDEITCRVTTGSSLVSGRPHSVSVRVKNRGFALAKIGDEALRTFTLRPAVSSINPWAGSVAGGTYITITGNGLSSLAENTNVLMGNTSCDVMSSSYTKIICRTQKSHIPGKYNVSVSVGVQQCACTSHVGCSFAYTTSLTPRVDYVTPTTILGKQNVITLYGSGFPAKTSDVTVTLGSTACTVMTSSPYSIDCLVDTLVAGSHVITVQLNPYGYPMFGMDASKTVTSVAVVSDLSPVEGSLGGGTVVTIKGNGFDARPGHTTVRIGTGYCVTKRVTYDTIICVTKMHKAGSFEVDIIANDEVFPRMRFAYRRFATPFINSLSTAHGKQGDLLAIAGSGFGTDSSKLSVNIGNSSCQVLTASNNMVMCTLGPHVRGLNTIVVHLQGRGLAVNGPGVNAKFQYDMVISDFVKSESGYGGGKIVTIKGSGLDSDTVTKVCGSVCKTVYSAPGQVQCEIPAYTGSADTLCPIKCISPDGRWVMAGFHTYKASLTSRISSVKPSRGGTGGGVRLTISGSGFTGSTHAIKVTIAGSACNITSVTPTAIHCTTGQRKGPVKTKVRLEIGARGIATQDYADFQYIDLWSSPFSWGNKGFPVEGDLVVVPKGQTMLLDVSTPVFAALVIKGELVFDEKDLVLNAEKIIIVEGGRLQVGTERQPFQHKARIVLHGSVRSPKMPIFGAKVLAVREGTLDLHGKHVPVTWTRLASTAEIGANQIHLHTSVTWQVGDKIILASTSRSQKENEELTITSVSSDGTRLGVTPTLKHKHIALTQRFGNKSIDTQAEVGLLTRNVVVRGSVQEEWTDEIKPCPEDFDPDQFATQSCFLGRYGSGTVSDQFGSQIMFMAREESKGLVTGRMSYVEVRHAGQAFRLGRYPIHFHMSGDVTGSYVRGCAVHHTFNRAVTIHGVQGLMVERNVAYHVMGHAYFIEDGAETGNTLQYNLGVFVTSSSSLLNTDVTPATFWITNPNNTVRHNAAAGGSHFGFWYNMPIHPGGPSYTPTVWPRTTPLGEFRNNTAHSFGRYGLWIFPTYIPLASPQASLDSTSPARFYELTAYNNLKGYEATKVGAVQAIDFALLDNKEAGFEVTEVVSPWGVARGGAILDSIVVGYSGISAGNKSYCTQAGLVGPMSSRLTVSGVTFANFDHAQCAALRGCSFCRPRQGGWSTRFEKTRLINAPNIAAFKWEHEAVFQDMDGTLTGQSGGGSFIATSATLPPQHCSQSSSASIGTVPGSICDLVPRFRRMAWNQPSPSSLLYKDVFLSNQYGVSSIPWTSHRLTHPDGWMAVVVLEENYNMTWKNAEHISNISYRASFYEFEKTDYFWITHPLKQDPDQVSTTGNTVNMSSGIPQYGHASSGDWYFDNSSKALTYLVSGDEQIPLAKRDVKLRIHKCYYPNCVKPVPPPPPEKRPLVYLKWSDPESWYGTEAGYGGYNKQLPSDGDDVIIKEHWWMVVDTDLPPLGTLRVYGTLEFETYMSHVLNATHIYVAPGANLIIGWPDQPMEKPVLITLRGDSDTPDMVLPNGMSVGAKTLGVFGNLEIHGPNKTVYWTRLERTAEAGQDSLQLVDSVDWIEGDMVVIAPTSYRSYETETFTITQVSGEGKTLRLNDTLRHKHLGETQSNGNHTYALTAEVGLLTRRVVIEGADDVTDSLENSFGGRVLIGSSGMSDGKERRVRIENVEFRHCGQEGWTDSHDPRYSLVFVGISSLSLLSYVRGNSFHHGYNTGLGVFGVDGLLVENNVIHHTVGSAVRVEGAGHRLIHNLAVLCVAPATYKGRKEKQNFLWSALFELQNSRDIVLRNNAAAGSERIGFNIRGERCHGTDRKTDWRENVAHTCLHGIHIGYGGGWKGCTRLAGFTSWKNWDYGIFTHSSSSIMLQDSAFIDNKAGVLLNVHSPPALSHKAAEKFVQLDRVLIVGTSQYHDCTSDNSEPINAFSTRVARGPRAKGGGHIGFLLSSFTSGIGMAPEFPWHYMASYPAIAGVTRLNSVTLARFGVTCGKRSVALQTNPRSEDVIHPTETRNISLVLVDQDSLVYFNVPNVKLVNPSDCVDMDCDGMKEVLISDLDGSLTGLKTGSIISKAEFEWNGEPRRGLGDYRIPTPMLTSPDGSKLDPAKLAPHHGIVRGTRTNSTCTWKAVWNAYQCHAIDYKMMVIESLDADTEVRRLSPVALSADGYTNLLNGPQDRGWCFGYTCQERISTFYAIAATHRNYTMYFTGTNPEKLRLRLLNSPRSAVLRVAIWYSTPQRLDVYRKGVYLYPTNADLKANGYALKKKDPKLPHDQFEPPLSSISGANYYDRRTQTMMVVLRGGEPVDIRTMPIIQLSIGIKAVRIDEFFEKNFVANLAALLGIDKSRIRIVEIVGASRRRRRMVSSKAMFVCIDIANPPLTSIPYTGDEDGNSTSGDSPTTGSPPASPSPDPNMMSFQELQSLATKVVLVAQTQQMAKALKIDVLSIDVTDPEPPRVDPTGGVRATNGTGGPANGTWRYDQKERWKEGNTTKATLDYRIPVRLLVTRNPRDANETVPFGSQPLLRVVDSLNRTVTSLGHGNGSQWFVTATIRPGTGDPDGRLEGNVTIPFIEGWANYTNLHITHSHDSYMLDFKISRPAASRLNASTEVFEVKERLMLFNLVTEPIDANETVPFSVQPVVEVRDAITGKLVTNTGWKGRRWLCEVSLENPELNKGKLHGSSVVEFCDGHARFTNLSIDHEGSGYILSLHAHTVPASRYVFNTTTAPFDVKQRELSLVIVRQPGDCNETVTCGKQPIIEIIDVATGLLAGNLGWRGRDWTLATSLFGGISTQNLVGAKQQMIPKSGRVSFKDIMFDRTGSDYRLNFTVTTSPVSGKYSGMKILSGQFEVKARKFFLEVVEEPGFVNASMPFGRQPVVEIRDEGTRRRATPLREPVEVRVSLGINPRPGISELSGGKSVMVVNETAVFTDLLITRCGSGYRLQFESNVTKAVLSAPFEAMYVNDFAPEFVPINPNYQATLLENTTTGTQVLTVSAVDHDKGSQGDVFFTIYSGNTDNSFAIDDRSGVIKTRRTLDREMISIYELTIRARDDAEAGKVRFTDALVSVIVSDVNDNSPVFSHDEYRALVKETARVGEAIIRARATDRDAGTNARLHYTITSGNEQGLFAINDETGDVTVAKPLDLEDGALTSLAYRLGVYVTDQGSPPRGNSTTVHIQVTPVNEFSPIFRRGVSRNLTIREHLDVGLGLALIDLDAKDKDYGIQGHVSYAIYSGNQAGMFRVDANGTVYLLGTLDYARAPSYRLVIRATDGGAKEMRKHADFTLTVLVEDINDNAPKFASDKTMVDVYETSKIGQVITVITATDADASTNGQVSYKIASGNDDDYFRLDSKTGHVTLSKSLDLEILHNEGWNRTLVVIATDHGTPRLHSNASFVFRLNSVNEFPPVWTGNANLSLSLSEDILVGSKIGRLSATDRDYGLDGEIRYIILSGNGERKFHLDEVTGVITIHAPLDRERTSYFRLRVQASDCSKKASSRRRVYAVVDIKVKDVNDNKPTFQRKSYYVVVLETAQIGGAIITVHASDSDEGPNGRVTYSIISGNDLGFFGIDSQTGTLRVRKSLDLETQVHVYDLIYILTISAQDQGTPRALNSTAIITIEIKSVNEFTPVLQPLVTSYIRVPESSPVGFEVVDLNATDKDFGADGIIRFAIFHGNEGNTFDIDSSTGKITVGKKLNFTLYPRYFLHINISDSGPTSQRRSLVTKVTVRVTNLNDNGGRDVGLLNLPDVLTSNGNLAELAGIPTSRSCSVLIIDQNGPTETLDPSDDRLTIDDTSASRGLFFVKRSNKTLLLTANSAGHLGTGILIIRVKGLYAVRLEVKIIGFKSLAVKALLHSSASEQPITTLNRVGPDGNYQKSDLRLVMTLTDSSAFDVTSSNMTSFQYTSYGVGVSVVLDTNPYVLGVSRGSKPGRVSLYGCLGAKKSAPFNLVISDHVIVAMTIRSVQVQNLTDRTLVGIVGTIAQVSVTMTMNDSSVMVISDFKEYRGLVRFVTSDPLAVTVDPSGTLTLRGDSDKLERVTVTNAYDEFDAMEFTFYCNKEPAFGEADLGRGTGPAVINPREPIPVRLGIHNYHVTAYNITISIAEGFEFKGLTLDVPYSYHDGKLSLVNVMSPGQQEEVMHVTDIVLVFDGSSPRAPVRLVSSVVVDNNLVTYPPADKPSCSKKLLGDVSSDCVLDVYDAAYAMAYALARENDFATASQKRLKEKTTKKMIQAMDVNLNSVVERSDAVLLAKASVDQARFLTSFHVNTPDHTREDRTRETCVFSVEAGLAYKNSEPINERDTQIYFELASTHEELSNQLKESRPDVGGLVIVYDGDKTDGTWGGVVRAQPKGSGINVFRLTHSYIQVPDLGISVVQVDTRTGTSVVTMFSDSRSPMFGRASFNVTRSGRVHLERHSPQRVVHNIKSTKFCQDPFIIKTIRMKFLNDFVSVQGKEEGFISALVTRLRSLGTNVNITTVKLSPGSIYANFEAASKRSIMNSFLLSLWNRLQDGFTLSFDGVIYEATRELLVDGAGYQAPETKYSASPFPVTTVIVVCVVVVVLVAMAVLVVCYHKHRMVKRPISAGKWNRISHMHGLFTRSQTNLESFGTELIFLNTENASHDEGGHVISVQNNHTKRNLSRAQSASSQVSVEAWGEDSPNTLKKTLLASGKVSPVPMMDSENESDEWDSPIPSPPGTPDPSQVTRATAASSRQTGSQISLSKVAFQEDKGNVFKNWRQLSKQRLSRQSSDSRLLDLHVQEGHEVPLSRPVLHKKMSLGGRLSPRSITPEPFFSRNDGAPTGSSSPSLSFRPHTSSGIAVHSNDITIEDEATTIRLPVNMLIQSGWTDGPDTGRLKKLGFIDIQSNSSLEDARAAICRSCPQVARQLFVLVDKTLMDIEPCQESTRAICGTFTESATIRVLTNRADATRLFCPCGQTAQFTCSACNSRGYCGQKCQLKDWGKHKTDCHNQSRDIDV